MEKYDNEIKNQNENKKQIISIGEEKIGVKNNEQKTLKKSLNDLEKKIKDQKARIEFLQNENIRLKKQKDNDFSFYMQKMEDHEKKYNLLNNKYINLKKQSDIIYNQNKEYLNPYLRMLKEAKISNEILPLNLYFVLKSFILHYKISFNNLYLLYESSSFYDFGKS